MKLAFVAAFLGGLCAQNAVAFSPASRSKVLNNLKEMSMEVKMTGAGGAAQPDQYVEGECVTWNRGIKEYALHCPADGPLRIADCCLVVQLMVFEFYLKTVVACVISYSAKSLTS